MTLTPAERYVTARGIDGEETLRRAAVVRGEGATFSGPAPRLVEGAVALHRGAVVEVRARLGTFHPKHLRGLSRLANTYWRVMEVDDRRWSRLVDVEQRELSVLDWGDPRALRLRARILACEPAIDRMSEEGAPCP